MAGAILALISFSAHAQSDKLSLQIYGGAGISNVRDFHDPDFGFAANASAFYRLNNTFSIGLGAGMEQIGAREEIIFYGPYAEPLFAQKTKVTYNYVSIPLLVRAEIGSKTKYFMNAGLTSGIFLNEKYYFSDQTQGTTYTTISNGEYNTLNLAASIGAGMMIPLGEKTSFTLEARENFGLTEISNKYLSHPKTQSAHLLLGLQFAL